MRTKLALTFILLFTVPFLPLAHSAQKKIGVMVSIPPFVEFVERIGGDRVSVTMMIPPGANPHTYEPLPSQLRALGQTQLFVAVGSGIEFELTWLDKIKSLNPTIEICDVSKGIERLNFDKKESAHHHSRFDPHTWLSPVNAIQMVKNIEKTLLILDPEGKALYEKEAFSYIEELKKLDKINRSNFGGLKNREFLVYHPAWGYFAKEYGLKEVAIEYEGKEPSARRFSDMLGQMKNSNLKVIFASPLMSAKSAEVVAKEIGAKIELIDELSQNYIQNLNSVSEKIRDALKG